jgi:hypothetical protein
VGYIHWGRGGGLYIGGGEGSLKVGGVIYVGGGTWVITNVHRMFY